MSWKLLREYLWKLPDGGPDGFEGLVARLIELTTGDKFLLAGTGLQPGGDASHEIGGVVLQAKRYRETTALNHSEIVGDVDRALANDRSLEVYVLAAARSIPSQLRAELNAIERATGLDVITLGFHEQEPDLGILCARHWDEIRDTPAFKEAPRDVASFLAAVRAQPDVQSGYSWNPGY